MNTQFLITNIDAIITTAVGSFFTVYALRNRGILSQSPHVLTRSLSVLGPIVALFGLILFLLPGSASDLSAAWSMVQTDDGMAQVKFPAVPTRSEATDRAGEIEVHRVTHVVDLSGGKLNLRLSYNQKPPGSEGLPDAARVAGIRDYFIQGGYEIVEEAELQDGTWALLVAQPNNKARISMRIAIRPNGIYRALATSMEGYHNDSRIDVFLNSFAANNVQAEYVAPRGH